MNIDLKIRRLCQWKPKCAVLWQQWAESKSKGRKRTDEKKQYEIESSAYQNAVTSTPFSELHETDKPEPNLCCQSKFIQLENQNTKLNLAFRDSFDVQHLSVDPIPVIPYTHHGLVCCMPVFLVPFWLLFLLFKLLPIFFMMIFFAVVAAIAPYSLRIRDVYIFWSISVCIRIYLPRRFSVVFIVVRFSNRKKEIDSFPMHPQLNSQSILPIL